ncbi:hypothetical protein KY319_01175, partial [Candidatus Woesearchaeota archaeon]|nr:hypothetical protein [Candidatus Woesearchaeota archaeon]
MLFLLVSCAKEDLPPTPPPPGGEADVGRAIGGVPIAAALPAWAARILYTDISPERPRFGDTVVVTVEKPSTFQRDFLVFSEAYVLNKKVPSYLFWEKVNADSSLSGSITQKWARNKAVFKIPITQERFTSGLDYLVVYWCVDSGMRDSQGKKIWECNGNKWGLGAFDVVTEAYPDFLIEKDIENNRFKGSAKVTPQSFVNVQVSSGVFGNAYAASYLDLLSVMTNVTVVELLDVAQFKKDLSKDIANLSAGWTTKGGNVCGFLNVGSGFVSFSWLSGYYWVTVKSSGNVLDEAKIGNYAKFKPPKYQSNCNLLNELKTIANISEGCGNLIVEAGEECERNAQCAEEEVCRDCVCVIPSVCGNNETEYGEDCESDAECEENEICSDCKCIPAGCGNKLLEEGEECEAHKDCDEGEYCIDCECIASSCGDEFLTPD